MAQDKIRLPSGQGGLTRYFDEYKSKVDFAPGTVIIMIVAVILLVLLLHYVGAGIFGA